MCTNMSRMEPDNLNAAARAAMAGVLRAEKARSRLTLEELVLRTSMSRSAIQRILRGTRDVDMAQLAQIATALATTPSDLMVRAEADPVFAHALARNRSLAGEIELPGGDVDLPPSPTERYLAARQAESRMRHGPQVPAQRTKGGNQ